MSVVVRRAVKKDAREIAGFAIRLFAQHHEYDARRFAEISSIEGAERFYGNQTEAQDATVLVAEVENKLVGFAYVQYEAIDYANLLENAAWLHDIYIDETARRSNAGKLLIEASIEAAKNLGADKLMLSVAAKNEYAKQFFERRGFRETMIEMTLNLSDEDYEVLNWIVSENVKDFAVNKFDYKKDAVLFFERLYAKGSVKVSVNRESILSETNELYADAVIVKLPEDSSQRNDVLHFCQTESQPGCYVEVKDDLVYLWWD